MVEAREIVADTTETPQEIVYRIAQEENFDFEILDNILWQESKWGKYMEGDGGASTGPYHIKSSLHPLTREETFDWEKSTRYFIDSYKKGNEWWWTSCSCIKTARLFGLKIPPVSSVQDLEPNISDNAVVGMGIMFNYNGVKHIGVIESITDGQYGRTFEIVDGNYEPCKVTHRTIKDGDQALIGFYTPLSGG